MDQPRDSCLHHISGPGQYFPHYIDQNNEEYQDNHYNGKDNSFTAALIFAFDIMPFEQVDIPGVSFIAKIKDPPDNRYGAYYRVEQDVQYHQYKHFAARTMARDG